MKKALISIWLVVASTMTWAACTTQTVSYNGKMMTCTTCCYGNNCNTTCF